MLVHAGLIYMHTFAAANFDRQIRAQTFLLVKSVNAHIRFSKNTMFAYLQILFVHFFHTVLLANVVAHLIHACILLVCL